MNGLQGRKAGDAVEVVMQLRDEVMKLISREWPRITQASEGEAIIAQYVLAAALLMVDDLTVRVTGQLEKE